MSSVGSVSGDGRKVLMVAGEASGDLHGARLWSDLAALRPGLSAFGLGGPEMREAGVATLADSAEISVVGITEVLKILPRAREIFRRILDAVDRERPALAVLVDFPDFNLRLARRLHERGVPVVYYVSPQVWAWRKGRLKHIARVVDHMLVLFPFEVEFYRQAEVPVTHVGHPLVDEVPEWPHVWDRPAAPAPTGDGQGAEASPYHVALLPGSRPGEVETLLPVMLRSVRLLAEKLPVLAQVVRAPSIERSLLDELIALEGVPVHVTEPSREERFAAVAGSHLALCASGTATLEVGLLGTPMLVLYKLQSWTYLLARLLVRLPHVSLVNLVLGHGAVPELIQKDAEPRRVAAEAASLLSDPRRLVDMRRDLTALRAALGESGASGRAARQVARILDGSGEADEVAP